MLHNTNFLLQKKDKKILKTVENNGEKLDAVLEKLDNMDCCSAQSADCEKGISFIETIILWQSIMEFYSQQIP